MHKEGEISVWIGGNLVRKFINSPTDFWNEFYNEFPELKQFHFKRFDENAGELIFSILPPKKRSDNTDLFINEQKFRKENLND